MCYNLHSPSLLSCWLNAFRMIHWVPDTQYSQPACSVCLFNFVLHNNLSAKPLLCIWRGLFLMEQQPGLIVT